jgi:hypothetical protein
MLQHDPHAQVTRRVLLRSALAAGALAVPAAALAASKPNAYHLARSRRLKVLAEGCKPDNLELERFVDSFEPTLFLGFYDSVDVRCHREGARTTIIVPTDDAAARLEYWFSYAVCFHHGVEEDVESFLRGWRGG